MAPGPARPRVQTQRARRPCTGVAAPGYAGADQRPAGGLAWPTSTSAPNLSRRVARPAFYHPSTVRREARRGSLPFFLVRSARRFDLEEVKAALRHQVDHGTQATRHRNLRGEARPVRNSGEGQTKRAQGTLADARRVRAELLLQIEAERQTTSTNGSPAHSASCPSLADWLGGRYADWQARAQNERTR